MGIEERKKKLMEHRYRWGDRPKNLPYHVPGRHHWAREASPVGLEFDKIVGELSVPEDAPTHTSMHRVATPIIPSKNHPISTQQWTFDSIVKCGARFHPVPRISATEANLSTLIDGHEQSGIPYIIEGWHKHPNWPKDKFHINWLCKNGPKDINVRNVHNWTDKSIGISEFVERSRAAPVFTTPEESERLYGKDAECPDVWNEWLHKTDVIPSLLLPDSPNNLLLNQPRLSPIETLMCYLGIGDTFTPCHKDLCASSGQNLMCYTENGGSSYWFMTKSSDAADASKYFHQLGQELDHETHVISVEQLSEAPFDVYIAEQKLGDLVLVPPRSCHQVVNHGGITIKTSWSRMTLKGLTAAYYHELPIYRRVCRRETYRVKSTIHYTLLRKTMELEDLPAQSRRRYSNRNRSADVTEDLHKLIQLFDDILVEEYSPDHANMSCLSSATLPLPTPTASPAPSSASSATLTPDDKESGFIPVTCDFCTADIFQSFFECRECTPGNSTAALGDGYAVCAGCYVEGRSCKCGTMDAVQCRSFDELLQDRNRAVKALHNHIGGDGLEKELKFSDLISTAGAFRAACVLQETRKLKKETKICAFSKETSHLVSYPSALSCKRCHSSKCFDHLLAYQKIHSIDAIANHVADGSHHQYHGKHNSRANYDAGIQGYLLSQREGSRPNFAIQRAHIALTYSTCKPDNCSYMSLGWYDRAALLNAPLNSNDEYSQPPEQPSVDEPALCSPVASTPLGAELSTHPASTRDVPLGFVTTSSSSVSKPGRRVVLDYVHVPTLPYNVKIRPPKIQIKPVPPMPGSCITGPSKPGHEDSTPPPQYKIDHPTNGTKPPIHDFSRNSVMSDGRPALGRPPTLYGRPKRKLLQLDVTPYESQPSPIHTMSRGGEGSSKRLRMSTSQEQSSNQAKKLHFRKSPQRNAVPPQDNNVQLANAYNLAATHNQRMMEEADSSDDSSETSSNSSTRTRALEPEISSLRQEIISLQTEMEKLRQPQPPPVQTTVPALLELLFRQLVQSGQGHHRDREQSYEHDYQTEYDRSWSNQDIRGQYNYNPGPVFQERRSYSSGSRNFRGNWKDQQYGSYNHDWKGKTRQYNNPTQHQAWYASGSGSGHSRADYLPRQDGPRPKHDYNVVYRPRPMHMAAQSSNLFLSPHRNRPYVTRPPIRGTNYPRGQRNYPKLQKLSYDRPSNMGSNNDPPKRDNSPLDNSWERRRDSEADIIHDEWPPSRDLATTSNSPDARNRQSTSERSYRGEMGNSDYMNEGIPPSHNPDSQIDQRRSLSVPADEVHGHGKRGGRDLRRNGVSSQSLSQNWEDEYVQDEDLAPERKVFLFRDPPQGKESQSPNAPALADPTVNPWQ